jgi:hypothetical protein
MTVKAFILIKSFDHAKKKARIAQIKEKLSDRLCNSFACDKLIARLLWIALDDLILAMGSIEHGIRLP